MSVISLEEWRKKQEKLSTSKSPSKQSIPWDEVGLTPTDQGEDFAEQVEHMVALWVVLDRCWRNPPSVKSNFAREGAVHVGLCASEGLISTCVGIDTWGTKWLVTEDGMHVKEQIDETLRQIASGVKPEDLDPTPPVN